MYLVDIFPMKIIRIILLSLLALGLIACTGFFIFFQTFDTDQYLSQITRKASLALGRPVSVGHMGLGWSLRGITLDAGPLTIADDPGFTTQPFIKADRVRIILDLRSLILSRKIHITGILLQSPQIHFIRSMQGTLNIQSIGKLSQSFGNIPEVKAKQAKQSFPWNMARPPSAPLSFWRAFPGNDAIMDVKSIKIQDAAISFIDQSEAAPLDIWLNAVNASLNDFSLSKPFPISLDACFYSHASNMHADTHVFLDLPKRSVTIRDLRFVADLSGLDIDGLKDISPEEKISSFFKNIAGVVHLNMANLNIGPSEGLAANGDINITGGVIKNFNIIKILFSHTLGVFGDMEGNFDNLFNGQLEG